MAGTSERRERRSVVDDGWEPVRPERGPVLPLLVGLAVALVAVPVVAFLLTYLISSR